VKKLDKKDIGMMKSFATPPVLVKEVAKAVMCMLKEKEDWKTAQI